MKFVRTVLLAVIAPLVAATGCLDSQSDRDDDAQSQSPDAPRVLASHPAIQYFANRVGEGRIAVGCVVPDGESPHDWKPNVESVIALQKAKLILASGPLEPTWFQNSSLPTARLRDLTAIADITLLDRPDAVTHQHGPGGVHAHRGHARNPWLDPHAAIKLTNAIRDVFQQQWPADEATFETNAAKLASELATLDSQLENAIRPLKSRVVMTPAPVRYAYLAERFDFQLKSSLDLEGQLESGDTEAILAHLEEAHANLIITNRAPPSSVTDTLADAEVQVLTWDSCETSGNNSPLNGMRSAIAELTRKLHRPDGADDGAR